MSESILEKVLDRRDQAEKQSFDAVATVSQLLSLISEKEAEVLSKRFGLQNHQKQTLEQIGREHNVTRERIRQIERQGIQSILALPAFKDLVKPVEHVVTAVLHQHGGVMTMDMLAEQILQHRDSDEEHRRALHFLLAELLNDKVEHIRRKDLFEPSWRLRMTNVEFVEEAIQTLHTLVEELGEPHPFETIHEKFQQTELYQKNQAHFSEPVVLSYLHVAATIGKNPFDEFGLVHWGQVKPKRMHDRVYLVLKKEGKPLHFEEIAGRITEFFGKKAYPPTVHNELILNEEYVLVGRGMYALREWGYQDGVVSDIITEVLKEAGKPLSRDEIVATVLQQRIVKKNTIYLALTDKSRFSRLPNGTYQIAESSPVEATA
jgi:DNA-binding winged helix-turn-helix (wHTH) protein